MAEEISEQELKDMKLNETKCLGDGILMMRVVGGWIYWRTEIDKIGTDGGVSVSNAVAGVFVPEK